jgi:hypothetical protein
MENGSFICLFYKAIVILNTVNKYGRDEVLSGYQPGEMVER